MKIAILGAGYAGLTLARRLERTLPEEAELVVVNDRPDHLVQHELHRVVRRPALAEEITVPLEDALKDPEAKVIGSRWVICTKNDPSDPDIRARLVAQEIHTHADHNFFAATPPLESKRMLFPQWATERSRGGAQLKLSFVDIRKA